MGWWAYTFPLDIITAAIIIYAHSTENLYLEQLGAVLLPISTIFILYILGRTLIEIKRGTVLVADWDYVNSVSTPV